MSSTPYHTVKHLIVTEKGTALAERGTYMFCVHRKARKQQVKQAVETLYKVHVERVRMMTMPPKRRVVRKGIAGERSRYKKALVTLREGDKIVIA